MKPRDVFRILREHLVPPLADLGFEPVKDSSGLFLVWTRPLKGKSKRYETIACQVNKWPWDPWAGSTFTLHMTRSGKRGNIALCKEYATLFELLDTTEKRDMQAWLNAVIARCRVPNEAEYNTHMGFPAYTPTGTSRVYREACTPVDLTKHQQLGLWLRFLNADDVAMWAKNLAVWIPRVLERDAAADWSKFGWGG